MKNKSKRIIKTLLLSATFAILHGSAKGDTKDAVSTDYNPAVPDRDLSPSTSDGQNTILKNVYKIMRNGDAKLIASHRSHSSHRSHRSHRSSSGGSYSSPRSRSYGGGGSGSSSHTVTTKSAADYSLGDRTLTSHEHGADVDQLMTYLVRFYYIKEGVASKKGGYHVYDHTVVAAIKHFQKDAELPQNGIVTSDVLHILKGWHPSKTTIPLGFRKLSTDEGTSGFDVDELVELLTAAGYAPDWSKLDKSYNHYIYSEDIATAVKAFQAYHNIRPDGELNSATIAKLKSYNK